MRSTRVSQRIESVADPDEGQAWGKAELGENGVGDLAELHLEPLAWVPGASIGVGQDRVEGRDTMLSMSATRLPPTTADLLDDDARPYFLWWTDATVGSFKQHLESSDPDERAYWMGALLREANTRDVPLFVNGDEIRALWPQLIRHLGRSREMWAWLLGLPTPEWPPRSKILAE